MESLPPTAASMGAFHLPSACEQPNATCPTWRDTLLTSDGTIVTLRGAFSHQAVLYRVAPSSMFRLRIKASRKNPVSVAGWTRTTSAAANGSWVEVTRQAVNGEGQHGYGCWFYPILPPFSEGTGIALNVGRTIAFQSFSLAAAYFNLTKQKGQLPDKELASKAHDRGYDSVQLLFANARPPELVLSLRCDAPGTEHVALRRDETVGD